jgi:CDP-3, 6-dideoxy-D-glycero-L-glycero-4-hexulose-4-reductase
MINSNYKLILNLLLGAAAKSTPLVIAGSFTQNSSANRGPVSVYSLTKEAASQASTYFAHEHRMKILELRIFDTYGAGDNRRKFLDLLVDAALSGEKLNASSGEQIIDLVNIVDVIDGLEESLVLLQKLIPGEHRIFEIASRNPKSLKELASLVESITEKKINATWGFYPYRRYEMFEYSTKYPLLPNWHPRVDLPSGIRELIQNRVPKSNE